MHYSLLIFFCIGIMNGQSSPLLNATDYNKNIKVTTQSSVEEYFTDEPLQLPSTGSNVDEQTADLLYADSNTLPTSDMKNQQNLLYANGNVPQFEANRNDVQKDNIPSSDSWNAGDFYQDLNKIRQNVYQKYSEDAKN
ncbi:unnamed protein product [Didymodactylos carnosus]|uniref:Uncharacterized protein n=1 Tax=Didymodactylos carnosus TaxID=1234261 RepID=A0A815XZL0_9BILA|nr:unnamed protein product [Didymodactylos carnosus]CAF1563831.1 unnamed protein product [Didymodactylos carnosus]CAF3920640.1 unnamed protein product [Didymodactylos carnosus]CAF4425654.1 unnamed protein product [Didymodactylos carnosus]